MPQNLMVDSLGQGGTFFIARTGPKCGDPRSELVDIVLGLPCPIYGILVFKSGNQEWFFEYAALTTTRMGDGKTALPR